MIKGTDEELVKEYGGNKTEIFDALYKRYENTVNYLCGAYFLIGGEKDDLRQEARMGLLYAVENYKEDKNCLFKTFAYRCIRNYIINAVRKANSNKYRYLSNYVSLYAMIGEELDDEIISVFMTDKSDPESMFLDRENYSALVEKIKDALSEKEYEILKLYLDGGKYTEIAEKLCVEEKSVNNAMQRVRKKLKEIIKNK